MAAAEAWVPVEVGQVLSQTNNGQGDCLFVAISQQLDGVMSSIALRQMAVAYLTDHREDFFDELLSLGWDMLETGEISCVFEGDLLVDAVLQVLANPWVWGGAECIAALGLALNREIRVYEENGPTITFPRGDDSLPPIRLLLRYPLSGGRRLTHYESVLAWRPESSSQSRGVSTSSTYDMGTQMPEQVSIPELERRTACWRDLKAQLTVLTYHRNGKFLGWKRVRLVARGPRNLQAFG
ncbi:Ubiquitin thioesterase otu2 [Frankliniella fusca]|uniref:Ubiquitin thioesterase otu2 n=1 Tax=Frankliniella fusca TaxID=407009 RepID=A0AAE1LG26_9NEOP|nr:Ubiquitin thioesterase otu2 [Frankliniella fusca]